MDADAVASAAPTTDAAASTAVAASATSVVSSAADPAATSSTSTAALQQEASRAKAQFVQNSETNRCQWNDFSDDVDAVFLQAFSSAAAGK